MVATRTVNLFLFGNTTQLDGPKLSYTKAEWRSISLAGVKRGDFDDLF